MTEKQITHDDVLEEEGVLDYKKGKVITARESPNEKHFNKGENFLLNKKFAERVDQHTDRTPGPGKGGVDLKEYLTAKKNETEKAEQDLKIAKQIYKEVVTKYNEQGESREAEYAIEAKRDLLASTIEHIIKDLEFSIDEPIRLNTMSIAVHNITEGTNYSADDQVKMLQVVYDKLLDFSLSVSLKYQYSYNLTKKENTGVSGDI